MNDNPGGTPNPLNPSPEPIRPTTAGQPAPVEQPTPATQPVQVEQPVTSAVSPSPTEAPAPAEKPKKKTGLIAAVFVCLLVAVGCGVAAILLALNKNSDPVMAAMQKLMSDQAPKIVSIEGDINVKPNDELMPYSALAISFDAGINTSTNENFADAVITAQLQSGTEFSFSADEIRTSDGDLYLKLSNITDALNSYSEALNATNCVGGEVGTNCVSTREVVDCSADDDGCLEDVEVIMPTDTDSVIEFIGVFEVIDDEWIRIPSSSFSNIEDTVPIDEKTQCLIDAAGKLGQFGNNISELYSKNPFINHSTENLKIEKKKDSLYRLSFDNEKLAGFINSMSNSGFINELLACTGGQATNQDVTADDISQITVFLPTIYVEIDGNNNFTRVYLDQTNTDDGAEITVDLSISYPTSITVQAPDEYIEIDDVLSQLLTNFYGADVYDFTE